MTSERSAQLRALGFVMLPIALFLERGVYYQFRAAFVVRAMDMGGATSEELGAVLAVGMWLGIAGYVLGGLLSLVKPHLAVLVGLAIALLGYLLMAVAPGGWAAANALAHVGTACSSLGFYAAIAGASSSLGQRVAGVSLLVIAASVGGFLGPLGATAARVSPWLAYVGLLPVLLAALLIVVDWWQASSWDKSQPTPGTSTNWGLGIGVVAAVTTLAVLVFPTELYASDELFKSFRTSNADPKLYMVGSVVTLGGGIVASIALALAGLLAPRVMRPASVAGPGLLCSGAGTGLAAVGAVLGLGVLIWIATFLAGIGTSAVDALLLALLLGAFPPRWVGLALAGYYSVTRAVAAIFHAVFQGELSTIVGGLSALIALGIGVAVLLLSKPLGALLAPEVAERAAEA